MHSNGNWTEKKGHYFLHYLSLRKGNKVCLVGWLGLQIPSQNKEVKISHSFLLEEHVVVILICPGKFHIQHPNK